MQTWKKVYESAIYYLCWLKVKCLLEKIHSCQKNPKKSYTEKKLCINLIVIQCSHIVHLMQQK